MGIEKRTSLELVFLFPIKRAVDDSHSMVPHALAFLLRLRLWEHLASLTDKLGEIVTVIDVSDIEIVLGPFVRWSHIDGAQQRTDSIRWLQIEAIVADKSEDLPVTINTIVAKHLLGNYLTCPRTLVSDILYKV